MFSSSHFRAGMSGRSAWPRIASNRFCRSADFCAISATVPRNPSETIVSLVAFTANPAAAASARSVARSRFTSSMPSAVKVDRIDPQVPPHGFRPYKFPTSVFAPSALRQMYLMLISKQVRHLWPDLLLSRWSCRELNPGPTAFPQDFSVRSSLCLYSDLPVTRTSRDDDPSRCLMSPQVPRPNPWVGPSRRCQGPGRGRSRSDRHAVAT